MRQWFLDFLAIFFAVVLAELAIIALQNQYPMLAELASRARSMGDTGPEGAGTGEPFSRWNPDGAASP